MNFTIRKYRPRVTKKKREKILAAKASGMQRRDILRMFKITQAVYYYHTDPATKEKALQRTRNHYVLPRKRTAEIRKKKYEYDKRYIKKYPNRIKKLKKKYYTRKSHEKKIKLILDIGKKLGLYEHP